MRIHIYDKVAHQFLGATIRSNLCVILKIAMLQEKYLTKKVPPMFDLPENNLARLETARGVHFQSFNIRVKSPENGHEFPYLSIFDQKYLHNLPAESDLKAFCGGTKSNLDG
eukprot:jgi/Bigna1/127486/aug1.4_g2194